MKISVIGSGGWGTALAILLNSKKHDVTLWSWQESECETLKRDRENKAFLPGVAIPERKDYKPKTENGGKTNGK